MINYHVHSLHLRGGEHAAQRHDESVVAPQHDREDDDDGDGLRNALDLVQDVHLVRGTERGGGYMAARGRSTC